MKIPETIYLQWFGDYEPDMLSESERDAIDPSGASWCWEQIFPHDIAYVQREAVDAVLSDLLLYVSQGKDSSGLTLEEAKARIIAGINTLARRRYEPTYL